MNRIKYLLFAIIMSLVLIPNVSAKGVEIKSITLDSKSNNTVIKSEPTFNGLVMDFDVSFKQKDDFAKYKVIVKNDTNIDYKIASDTSFNKSEHITYTYDVENVLKPKGEAIVYVTITYSKEVDPEELTDGMYKEENKAIIQLLNKEGEIANPNTGVNSIIIISLLLLVLLISTVMIKKKKKVLVPIIISILLIPTIVYAVETLKLTINVKVQIESGHKVSYVINTPGVFKNEELEEYNIERSDCKKTYYIGDMTEENKYNYCETTISRTDDKFYKSGERVTIKDFSVNRITTEKLVNGQWVYYCEEQEPKVYLCDNDTPIYPDQLDRWGYSIGPRTNNPNGLDSDKETMNFSSIHYDEWETYKRLTVDAQETFSMPEHDVVFYINNYFDR